MSSGVGRHVPAIIAAGALCLFSTCQAAGLDACKLIGADQASRILGSQVSAHAMDTAAAGPDAGSMCNYTGEGAGGGFMLIAGHVHYTDAAMEVARREHEALSDTPPGLPKPSFSAVEGLGDAAYLAKATGYFQLHVLAHGSVIVINRNMAASTPAVEQTKALARAALERLK